MTPFFKATSFETPKTGHPIYDTSTAEKITRIQQKSDNFTTPREELFWPYPSLQSFTPS